MTCMQTVSLGAYVLGALDADERQTVEEHLRDCAYCRDELVRLAPLPGLLSQVSLDELDEPEGDRPLDPATWQPPEESTPWWRRARVLASAAAVVAVLSAVGVAGQVVINDNNGQQTAQVAAAATWSTAPGSGIQATATLSQHEWGTGVQLAMDNLPSQSRCRLVVWSNDGRMETAGWWTTGYSKTAEVPTSTSINLGSISRMEVRTNGHTLAVLQPSSPA
ncbi:MAG TPA: zf-HC2 domain-containing protein [Nocardioidaceae bacterium]|nr:zf-HC2 domain-containing protein [Nocardioidaceae bacterium]